MPGQISVENGKKGGRPKGSKATHTLEAERAKIIILQRYLEALEPILNKAVEQAIAGDKAARDWLSERATGKVPNAIELPGGRGELKLTWEND
jgi:hypothetical protein